MKKINIINHKKPIFFLSLTLLILSSSAYGANYLTGGVSDLLYYKIGGGSVMGSNYALSKPHSIGLGVKWNANLMCGNFDIKSTVSNQLPSNEDEAYLMTMEKINSPDWKRLEPKVIDAQKTVIKAFELGIKKYPAIVINDDFVSYGTLDVSKVMAEFLRRQANDEN